MPLTGRRVRTEHLASILAAMILLVAWTSPLWSSSHIAAFRPFVADAALMPCLEDKVAAASAIGATTLTIDSSEADASTGGVITLTGCSFNGVNLNITSTSSPAAGAATVAVVMSQTSLRNGSVFLWLTQPMTSVSVMAEDSILQCGPTMTPSTTSSAEPFNYVRMDAKAATLFPLEYTVGCHALTVFVPVKGLTLGTVEMAARRCAISLFVPSVVVGGGQPAAPELSATALSIVGGGSLPNPVVPWDLLGYRRVLNVSMASVVLEDANRVLVVAGSLVDGSDADDRYIVKSSDQSPRLLAMVASLDGIDVLSNTALKIATTTIVDVAARLNAFTNISAFGEPRAVSRLLCVNDPSSARNITFELRNDVIASSRAYIALTVNVTGNPPEKATVESAIMRMSASTVDGLWMLATENALLSNSIIAPLNYSTSPLGQVSPGLTTMSFVSSRDAATVKDVGVWVTAGSRLEASANITSDELPFLVMALANWQPDSPTSLKAENVTFVIAGAASTIRIVATTSVDFPMLIASVLVVNSRRSVALTLSGFQFLVADRAVVNVQSSGDINVGVVQAFHYGQSACNAMLTNLEFLVLAAATLNVTSTGGHSEVRMMSAYAWSGQTLTAEVRSVLMRIANASAIDIVCPYVGYTFAVSLGNQGLTMSAVVSSLTAMVVDSSRISCVAQSVSVHNIAVIGYYGQRIDIRNVSSSIADGSNVTLLSTRLAFGSSAYVQRVVVNLDRSEHVAITIRDVNLSVTDSVIDASSRFASSVMVVGGQLSGLSGRRYINTTFNVDNISMVVRRNSRLGSTCLSADALAVAVMVLADKFVEAAFQVGDVTMTIEHNSSVEAAAPNSANGEAVAATVRCQLYTEQLSPNVTIDIADVNITVAAQSNVSAWTPSTGVTGVVMTVAAYASDAIQNVSSTVRRVTMLLIGHSNAVVRSPGTRMFSVCLTTAYHTVRSIAIAIVNGSQVAAVVGVQTRVTFAVGIRAYVRKGSNIADVVMSITGRSSVTVESYGAVYAAVPILIVEPTDDMTVDPNETAPLVTTDHVLLNISEGSNVSAKAAPFLEAVVAALVVRRTAQWRVSNVAIDFCDAGTIIAYAVLGPVILGSIAQLDEGLLTAANVSLRVVNGGSFVAQATNAKSAVAVLSIFLTNTASISYPQSNRSLAGSSGGAVSVVDSFVTVFNASLIRVVSSSTLFYVIARVLSVTCDLTPSALTSSCSVLVANTSVSVRRCTLDINNFGALEVLSVTSHAQSCTLAAAISAFWIEEGTSLAVRSTMLRPTTTAASNTSLVSALVVGCFPMSGAANESSLLLGRQNVRVDRLLLRVADRSSLIATASSMHVAVMCVALSAGATVNTSTVSLDQVVIVASNGSVVTAKAGETYAISTGEAAAVAVCMSVVLSDGLRLSFAVAGGGGGQEPNAAAGFVTMHRVRILIGSSSNVSASGHRAGLVLAIEAASFALVPQLSQVTFAVLGTQSALGQTSMVLGECLGTKRCDARAIDLATVVSNVTVLAAASEVVVAAALSDLPSALLFRRPGTAVEFVLLHASVTARGGSRPLAASLTILAAAPQGGAMSTTTTFGPVIRASCHSTTSAVGGNSYGNTTGTLLSPSSLLLLLQSRVIGTLCNTVAPSVGGVGSDSNSHVDGDISLSLGVGALVDVDFQCQSVGWGGAAASFVTNDAPTVAAKAFGWNVSSQPLSALAPSSSWLNVSLPRSVLNDTTDPTAAHPSNGFPLCVHFITPSLAADLLRDAPPPAEATTTLTATFTATTTETGTVSAQRTPSETNAEPSERGTTAISPAASSGELSSGMASSSLATADTAPNASSSFLQPTSTTVVVPSAVPPSTMTTTVAVLPSPNRTTLLPPPPSSPSAMDEAVIMEIAVSDVLRAAVPEDISTASSSASVVSSLSAPGDAMMTARVFAALRTGACQHPSPPQRQVAPSSSLASTGRNASSSSASSPNASLESNNVTSMLGPVVLSLPFPRTVLPVALFANDAMATAALGNAALVLLAAVAPLIISTVAMKQPQASSGDAVGMASGDANVSGGADGTEAVGGRYTLWAKFRFPAVTLTVGYLMLDGTAFAVAAMLMSVAVGDGTLGVIRVVAIALGSLLCVAAVAVAVAVHVVNPLCFCPMPELPCNNTALKLLLRRRGAWFAATDGRCSPQHEQWTVRFQAMFRPAIDPVRGGDGLGAKAARFGVAVDAALTAASAGVEVWGRLRCGTPGPLLGSIVISATAFLYLIAAVPHPSPVKAALTAVNAALCVGVAVAVYVARMAASSVASATIIAQIAVYLACASGAVSLVTIGVSVLSWLLGRRLYRAGAAGSGDGASPRRQGDEEDGDVPLLAPSLTLVSPKNPLASPRRSN